MACKSRHDKLPSGESPVRLNEWSAKLDSLEHKRRLLQKKLGDGPVWPPESYFVLATCLSFGLEGIELSEREVLEAMNQGPMQRRFRSRKAQRIRNHLAILHGIEAALRQDSPLKISTVLRWYTMIGSGLSTTELSSQKIQRLEQAVGRINSPQFRLRPAIVDVARLHADLLADPLFPSFNGILSRLLLRYHLGRCGFAFALFDADAPLSELSDPRRLMPHLLRGLERGYDLLLG